jgi:hypothetical protein
MKKHLVLYHSFSGNNKLLAEKTATALNADILEIKSKFKGLGMRFLISWLGFGSGINISEDDLEGYDEAILWGPVWGGLLIGPLRDTIKHCVSTNTPFHLNLCCGTDESEKDSKWGYAKVLRKAEQLGEGKMISGQAFPVRLVLSEEEAKDKKKLEEAVVNEQTYGGRMQARLNAFINTLSE